VPQLVVDHRILPPGVRRGVEAFDREVDAALEHLRGNPVADRVFYGASALGDHSFVWLALGAWRGLRSRSHHRRAAAVRIGVGLGFESALVNGVVKSFFRRSRPNRVEHATRKLRTPRSSSFPSGHATSGFMAATLLTSGRPRQRLLWYGLAAVVASSRVHVRIHHASDVVAGAAVGVGLGVAAKRWWPLGNAERPNGH